MPMRRRGVSLVALPFVSLVWLVGWVLYCLGSSRQRLARGGKKSVVLNVPIGLRLNASGARLGAGNGGCAELRHQSRYTVQNYS